MVKITKGALQRAKAGGEDPHLALLHLRATPVDAHLPSPAEMLFNRRVRTTIPSRIQNNNPAAEEIRDHLENKAKNSKAYYDRSAKDLAPMYAGQQVAMYHRIKKFWVPATIARVLPNDSYLIHTQNGSTYRCTHCDLRECHTARKAEEELALRPTPAWRHHPETMISPSRTQEPQHSQEESEPPPLRRSSHVRKAPNRLIEA